MTEHAPLHGDGSVSRHDFETASSAQDAAKIAPCLKTPKQPTVWDRYYQAPPSLQKDADNRLKIARHISELQSAGSSLTSAFISAADRFDVCPATAKNIWKKVRHAPPTEWLPLLVKNYKPRQQEPIADKIMEYFFGDYSRGDQPSLQAVWERTVAAAAHNGWGKVPCAKTLKRRWDRLSPDVKALRREGKCAFPEGRLPNRNAAPLDRAVPLIEKRGVGVAAIGGVEVVTIPLSDYAELLACRKRLEEITRRTPIRSFLKISRIEQYPDIKAFVLPRLGSVRLVDIAAECKRAFGDRAPSATAIHRFWQKSRRVRPEDGSQGIPSPLS